MNATFDIANADLAGLSTFVTEVLKEKPFRAAQIFHWLHLKGVTQFEQMTDLSKPLRQKLAELSFIRTIEKDLEQRSQDGTVKYRFKTHDGALIESVYMPSKDRKTLCVSTQVGCAMACRFCATAQLGLKRHLTASEIVAQVHRVNALVRADEKLETDRPLTNLVFMGMGEPLHNFENVKKALSILQDEKGPNFSHRHITVSTVGLVPMIERFAKETQAKLAISLNASDDETRDKIMPVNKRWTIADLFAAVRKFPSRWGRRITFEYVLMRGVNDSDLDIERLAKLLDGVPAKVNVIPYNDNPGLGFQSVDENRAETFQKALVARGVTAMVRQNRGRDIAAACGQLANQGGASGKPLKANATEPTDLTFSPPEG